MVWLAVSVVLLLIVAVCLCQRRTDRARKYAEHRQREPQIMTDRLLVLVRHGQSDWNLKNLFTGWRDIDLTEKGVAEAREAGRKLKAQGIKFDVAFTSALIRAQRTLDLMLEEMGQSEHPGVQGPGAQRARLRRSFRAQQGRRAQEMGRGAGAHLAPLLRRGAAGRRKPASDTLARALPYYMRRFCRACCAANTCWCPRTAIRCARW